MFACVCVCGFACVRVSVFVCVIPCLHVHMLSYFVLCVEFVLLFASHCVCLRVGALTCLFVLFCTCICTCVGVIVFVDVCDCCCCCCC